MTPFPTASPCLASQSPLPPHPFHPLTPPFSCPFGPQQSLIPLLLFYLFPPPSLRPPSPHLPFIVTRVSEVQVLGGGRPHRHPHAHLRPHRPRGRHCTTPTLDPGRQRLAPPAPPDHALTLAPPILYATNRQEVRSISHAHKGREPIHVQLRQVVVLRPRLLATGNR